MRPEGPHGDEISVSSVGKAVACAMRPWYTPAHTPTRDAPRTLALRDEPRNPEQRSGSDDAMAVFGPMDAQIRPEILEAIYPTGTHSMLFSEH